MSNTFVDLPDDIVKSRYIVLDNDFLNQIFKNVDFFLKVTEIFKQSSILLDPLTAFEFNRDVFSPKEIEKRSQFLAAGLFFPTSNHSEIFTTVIRNALLLSKIYKKNGCNSDSSIDLLLAGRIMYMRSSNPLLVTGNKKHFPSSIFNTLGVISSENDKNGDLISYAVLEFNKAKFEEKLADLNKIPSSLKTLVSFKFDNVSEI